MRTLLLLAVLLPACHPTEKPATDDDSGGSDLDSGDTPDSGDTGDTGDTDPAPDTAATDCAVDLPAAGTVATDPACAPGAADPDPFEFTLERRLVDFVPRHAPVVAHVDDDDGDGQIGPGDRPEIVSLDRYGGSFGSGVAVYGTGTRPLWSHRDAWYAEFDPIFADLDGDGAAELVVATDSAGWETQIVALDGATGAEKWRSETVRLDCLRAACQTTAADLDGDGVAEVILDNVTLDGATGAVVAERVLPDVVMFYRGPLAADLDGDGGVELVLGDTAFDADGTQTWTFGGEARSAFPALVQLDDDPEAEIALSLDYELLLLEADGSERARVAIPGAARFGWAGPPCVGDIDADGAAEVVVPGGESLDAFDADGTRAWSAAMSGNDGTGWFAGTAGCAVFDFDRDGAQEVVIGDALGLRILDGATGATLAATVEYGAYMEMQVPVLADVDGDGSAELLAASTGHLLNPDDWAGLQVYGHPRDAWRTDATVWGVHDYAVVNQNEHGGFPTVPAASWREPGLFRGQAAAVDPTEALPALVVDVVDACDACAGDVARVAVTVGNVGAAEAIGGSVELRAVTTAGDVRVLARADLDPVASGATHAGVELAWAPSDVTADERLEVAAVLAGEACDVDGRVRGIDPVCE